MQIISPAEPETQERESDTPTLPEEDTEPSVQEESATAHNETAVFYGNKREIKSKEN